MLKFAPIILCVYDQPKLTRQTLQLLEKNIHASESLLYIFSDAPKDADSVEDVNKLRSILREPWEFKHITIIERQRHLGVDENLFDAVSKITEKHGKAIVLTDNLQTSTFALSYFNDALIRYEHEEQIRSISGYMYPVQHPKRLPKTFFFRLSNAWGFATWQRAWKDFALQEKEITLKRKEIKSLNIDGQQNFWELHNNSQLKTWATAWYLHIFKQNGLVLYPRFSMTSPLHNEHKQENSYLEEMYTPNLSNTKIKYFPTEIKENKAALEAIKSFYKHKKGPLIYRLLRYITKKPNRPLEMGKQSNK